MSDSENIKYAGFWIRGLAMTIDTILFLPLSYLSGYIIAENKMAGYWAYEVLCVLYFVILESSKYQGTIGKLILRLKVRNIRGMRISILRAFTRFFIEVIPTIPFILVIPTFLDPHIRTLLSAHKANPNVKMDPELFLFIGQFQLSIIFMLVVSLIWFLPIAFTKQKTGIHDLLSKTRVIKVSRANEA